MVDHQIQTQGGQPINYDEFFKARFYGGYVEYLKLKTSKRHLVRLARRLLYPDFTAEEKAKSIDDAIGELIKRFSENAGESENDE